MRGLERVMSSVSPRRGFLAVAFWASLMAGSGVTAQPAQPASAPTQRGSMPQTPATTAWNALSPLQQQALKPLAARWNTIDEAQKRKWLAVSRNFGTMPAAEQAKLHSRMTEWVALSPKERTQARLNFAETKKLPADEKMAKWQAYQALSPEEKRKLAASASSRPPGAATAVQPVPAQKLATPPNAKPPRSSASGAAIASRQLDQKTLLPRPAGSTPEAVGAAR